MSGRAAVISLHPAARHRYSLAFDTDQARLYHRVRPSYQAGILHFLTDQPPGTAVDLGAGTGLFSTTLIQAGWDVVAVDPAAHMLDVLTDHHPHVATVVSNVEDLDTTSWQQQADLVVCAQAWHWIDYAKASKTVEQLLTDTGVFGIVHHHIDTSQDWVLRLCKIMHSGDVHPVHQPPKISEAFEPPVGHWWHWAQHLTVVQVHDLMSTRAYYLRTSDKQRRRMHNNLDWYLIDHLGYTPDSTIKLPYITAAWRTQRTQLGVHQTR